MNKLLTIFIEHTVMNFAEAGLCRAMAKMVDVYLATKKEKKAAGQTAQ